MRCSAVLLAGGRSSRMGRDKAFLEFEGEPLWRRQLGTLQRLEPAQIMISGSARAEWNGYEIVTDETVDAGPLAGVAAALQKCATPLLVVLAADLPRMTTDFLRSLLAICGEGRGAVPRAADGFEPLAAVYPASCACLAAAALRSGDFSMQDFIRGAIEQGLLVEQEIFEKETSLFLNLNTPSDL
jgi:molybdopterin-guanine dinucleotide biosynthesis protein A